MSWQDILKDTRSELKEMFSQDEDIIERYDSAPDEIKAFVDMLLEKISENPNRKAQSKASIYAMLGFGREHSTSKTIDAETKAAEEYLEDLSIQDVPEFKELKRMFDDLEEMLGNKLPVAIMKKASKEAQEGLTDANIREHIVHLVKDMWGNNDTFIDRATRTLHSQKQEEAETNEVMQQLKVIYESQMQDAMRQARTGATIAELKDGLVNALESELEIME